ncbi:MAG: ISAzo13 family transposase [Cetobacterium sp.]
MINDILGKCKEVFIESVNKLKGSDKRIALAKTCEFIGIGGKTIVAKEFKVSRNTIRKGYLELTSDIEIVDKFNERGRKSIEEKLPNILEDIKNIVDCQSQTDPNFKTTRLFTRLTVKEVRNQLILQKGYKSEELPTLQTLNSKINKLGYTLKKVRKVKPVKKIPEINEIFNNLNKVHEENKDKENVIRISIDTKDRVKIGDFSRGGYSRLSVEALDHDFSDKYLVPFGILNLTTNKVEFIFTETKATSDFMVDSIESYWVKNNYHTSKDTIIINSDNGPENSSRRTQFMKRIIEFSAKYNVKVILAYYPPYHSKYNPIERVWGALEKHWNGDILDSTNTIIKFAGSMTWKGNNPSTVFSDVVYKSGKKVSKEIMKIYESMIDRAATIGKWFIEINPQKCQNALNMEIKP